MRLRRALVGLSIVFMAFAGTLLEPPSAHAGECHTVWVGPQSFTVCP